MITINSLLNESVGHALLFMPKEKKILKSLRLDPLAAGILEAEMEDRRKRLGKKAKVTEASVVEEALYRAAALNPKYRERIINELKKDPRFSAIADSLASKGKDDAKA